MKCDDVREQLLDWLYDSLPPRRAGAIEEHLEHCEGCGRALETAREQRSVLAEAARAGGEGLCFVPPRPRWITGGRVAAAAALLLFLAGIALYRHAERGIVLAAHPRLVVTGPTSWPASEAVEFEVRAETVDGAPLRFEGRAVLGGAPDAERKLEFLGRKTIRFPAGVAAPGTGLTLSVTGTAGSARVAGALRLRADYPECLASVTTDKPLYRPGETVRARAVVLQRFRLTPAPDREVYFVLTGARRTEITRVPARLRDGTASADLRLNPEIAGGDFELTLKSEDGALPGGRRRVEVRTYRVPRLTTTLAFDRESYGPGDRGVAWLSVERAEGGVPEGATVRAALLVNDDRTALGEFALPESGALSIPFTLPPRIYAGRASLSAVVADGGDVEAAAKTVPVALGRIDVGLFPEGGELVAGLPGRVYFRARTPDGRPASLVADLVDSKGAKVARARTEGLGMGRFSLSPRAGESYRLVAVSPEKIRLAGAEIRPVGEGVALAADEGAYPAGGPIDVTVAATKGGEYEVEAFCRGTLIARRTARLDAGKPARVELEPTADVGGVVRITVFDPEGTPRAERLVSRAPSRRLLVHVEPEPAAVSPGRSVRLRIETTDAAGTPVPATLGLTVVDSSVLALGGAARAVPLPLHFLLASDVDELEDAAPFEGGPDAARATDRLLGVQGWRRFAWRNPTRFRGTHPLEGARVVPAPPSRAVGRSDNLDSARIAARPGLLDADRHSALAAGLILFVIGIGAVVTLLARERPRHLRRLAFVLAVPAAGVLLVVFAAGTMPAAGTRERVERPVTAAARPALAAAGLPEPEVLAADPAKGVFFQDHLDGDYRGRREAVYERAGAPVASVEWERAPAVRRDYEEVLCFEPRLETGRDGRAVVTVKTSDSVTTFTAVAEGTDGAGGLGRGEATIASRLPFYVEPKLPAEISARDRLHVPVAVSNRTAEDLDVDLRLSGTGHLLRLPGDAERRVRVAAGAKSRAGYDLVAGDGRGEVELTLTAAAGEGHTDRVVRSVEVVPRGYSLEIAKGGMIEGEQTVIPVLLPADLDRSSLAGELTIYPNTLTTLADGLESMLRRPCGCFEQTSSANYPNVMILSLLERSGEAAPAAAARARSLLDDGYRKLTTFECPGRGYEWFGRDPANPALTAYGLLEFTDMARVHRVDPEMLARTRRWLLEGRDGAGGFRFGTGRALDSFGAAPHGVTKAYVLWALTEADAKTDLGPELRALRDEARASEDPYFLALSALALGNRGDPATAGLTRRLAELQKGDGGLVGTTTSITSSRGSNLEVETTALAAIAFLRDPAERGAGESAIRYLVSKRRGGGGFGATQATILALRALLEQARHAAKTESEMDLTLFVNNRVAGHGHVHPGMRRPVVFSRELLDDLEEGGSEIMVRAEGEGSLPFALSLRYHTRVPPTDAGCAVGVATALDREQAREGESVGLAVTLTNREKGAVPMTLARVGLPAGLTPRIEALRELVKSGAIDSYEVRPREVALYLRGMAPSETKTVNLDLTAEFPGDFEGPATSAYLYYTDTQKSWAAPLRIRIAE